MTQTLSGSVKQKIRKIKKRIKVLGKNQRKAFMISHREKKKYIRKKLRNMEEKNNQRVRGSK